MTPAEYEPDDLEVQIAELLVATSDAADKEIPSQVQSVLKLLRDRLGMDVVFVSQIKDGRRTFMVVDNRPDFTVIKPGLSDPVEETWCQRVVDGRLPEVMKDATQYIKSGDAPPPAFPIGTHLSTPVRLVDGSVYGTICCFSQAQSKHAEARDIDKLRYTASLLAAKLFSRVGPDSSS